MAAERGKNWLVLLYLQNLKFFWQHRLAKISNNINSALLLFSSCHTRKTNEPRQKINENTARNGLENTAAVVVKKLLEILSRPVKNIDLKTEEKQENIIGLRLLTVLEPHPCFRVQTTWS